MCSEKCWYWKRKAMDRPSTVEEMLTAQKALVLYQDDRLHFLV